MLGKKILIVLLHLTLSLADERECDRFSPEEVRAIFFQPLMIEKIKFLKNTLTAAIDGLEEIERKAGDMPEHMKSQFGMSMDEELDNDSAEDMKNYLNEVLDSALR